jgi:ABC-type uncharacterized transport system auxiliary subunit
MKILLLSLLLLLSACSTTYPAITQYKIDVSKNMQKTQSHCSDKALKVSQVFVKSSLMSKKMKYIVGQYKEFAFNQSEWAQDPNRAITNEIVDVLRASGSFRSVVSYKSMSSSDYTLETTVDDFTQYFSTDENSSLVKVAISFSLIDNATRKIIATKQITREKKTKENTAQSGVKALNSLLSESLREMSFWLAKSCK